MADMQHTQFSIDDTFVCNSVTLAKYITAYANAHRFGINMTKLQKLLYITYGVYLAVKGQRLTNEHPQAWPYGPVFPTTRNKLLKMDMDSIGMSDDIRPDEEVRACVKLVFDSYGKLNASSLSEWSHKEGSPWDLTVSKEGFRWGDTIPDDYIYDYFKGMITVKDEDNGQ